MFTLYNNALLPVSLSVISLPPVLAVISLTKSSFRLNRLRHFRDLAKDKLCGTFLIKKQAVGERTKWRLAMWYFLMVLSAVVKEWELDVPPSSSFFESWL